MSDSNRGELSDRRDSFRHIGESNGSVASLKNIAAMSPTHSTHKSSEYSSETSTRRNSFGSMPEASEANVLVIYTGGTIGMVRNDKNGKARFVIIYDSFVNTLQRIQAPISPSGTFLCKFST